MPGFDSQTKREERNHLIVNYVRLAECGSKSGNMINVVIVDDHQVVRTGLMALLENAPGIEVAAEFADGSDFLTALPELSGVDVVLLDISMPKMGGLEVLHELVTMPKAPGVIFLTVYPEESYALQAIRAGAKGYLTKDSSREMLVEAVTAVAYGGTFLSEKIRQVDVLR